MAYAFKVLRHGMLPSMALYLGFGIAGAGVTAPSPVHVSYGLSLVVLGV